MNFQQFGVPISAALPIATQYQGGKITQNVTTPNGQVVGLLQGGENGVHYLRPFDINSFAASQPSTSNGQQAQTLITLPITMPGAKPGDPQQTVQIQVINPQPMSPPSPNAQQKFHMTQIPIQTFGQGATVLTVAYNGNQEGIQIVDGQNGIPEGMTVVAAIQPQDIQLIQTDPNEKKDGLLPVALIKSEVNKDDANPQENGAPVTAFPTQYLQNTSVQEYLQKMQQNTALPLSLQQFLKFNAPGIKQEQITEDGVLEQVSISAEVDQEQHLVLNSVDYMEHQEENPEDADKNKKKKKYKKKPAKPKKPKPGQVHIATALDGTTLFCCPECHMAYPEKDLLESHLVGHKIERRFICDICGAGLKRKEHLERHKLGHNPERPFVCSVCMKGFKRKEHLNLHYVIHSGEKTEICDECGKGFYRKDHLRKHQRSHVTRRAKEQAERQSLLSKEGTAQVTIQMPTQQLQIPVQIQVPQHHIQMATQQEEENSQVSTVVLPASEALSILPN
ncbi:zinc finger protein 182-like [Harmonia axyridis]|uniref:zinc finger protein 182-like n=1 Tax=Harmonia axyridis TaxID=115357 RepID=UPI001E275AD4|nr:zinc finger protein 182-like [Harmonia axyridis]XP_045476327.1 zinc finger protein 182-like [Harmonia axyridis]XP_045476328.1 zinc finger protein 182-like [Harmonia axyridis]